MLATANLINICTAMTHQVCRGSEGRPTSTVLPEAAVSTSPGRMPLPSIMFSHEALMMWTCMNMRHAVRHAFAVLARSRDSVGESHQPVMQMCLPESFRQLLCFWPCEYEEHAPGHLAHRASRRFDLKAFQFTALSELQEGPGGCPASLIHQCWRLCSKCGHAQQPSRRLCLK